MDRNNVHIRVIDQRIGMGIGGMDTVIRAYHVPTGVLVEVPSGLSRKGQHHVRETAIEMLEYAIASLCPPPKPQETP